MSEWCFEKIDPLDWESLSAVSRIDLDAFGSEGLRPSQLSLLGRAGEIMVIREDKDITAEAVVLGSIGKSKAFLFSLAVDDGLRRKGRGLRLMLEILRYLQDSKVETIELTVDPQNLPALNFYRSKLGFREIGYYPCHLGPNRPRLLFSKSLT